MGITSLFGVAAAAMAASAASLAGGSQHTTRLRATGAAGAYHGPHSSPNFVAHDKRRSKKVRNRARHRLAMKRRGR